MKQFHINTEIFFGESALDRLYELPFSSTLIITDPFVVSSGMITLMTNRLDKAHIEYDLFTDVVPDPPVEKVISGVAAALSKKHPCIIGVGGGSAIDTAKAVRKFATQMDDSYKPYLIAIPTTSGTGSEVTCFAVISNPDEGRKYPLAEEQLLPDEAILDEVLVKSVPASVTADTGMDVMTHAIEAYVSTNNNEFSGALAEKAVEISGQFLIRSYSSCEDTHARRKMHIASCLAGLAFNSASLGLNHGMAHQLGARFHIPHGRANAILLPYIIEFNSGIGLTNRSQREYPSCVKKYCNLARILGVSNMNEVTTIRALISYLHFLNAEMGIPSKVSDACPNLSKEEYDAQVDAMAEAALRDGCTATNPRIPMKPDIIEIYKKIW
ncbi:MAG: iron-containing alcohol dehydrogenase [Clostridia bacterium]|nr:iron-containing alcohol dehydrogenase [Clostridia bacterium]